VLNCEDLLLKHVNFVKSMFGFGFEIGTIFFFFTSIKMNYIIWLSYCVLF